jgi:hypothetical protein
MVAQVAAVTLVDLVERTVPMVAVLPTVALVVAVALVVREAD